MKQIINVIHVGCLCNPDIFQFLAKLVQLAGFHIEQSEEVNISIEYSFSNDHERTNYFPA